MKVQGTVLHAGAARGPTLVLTEPLSFWGAFDPREGKIVDVHHPQCGAVLAGHVLLLPETRGSGGTPGGIAEAIRRQTGPWGIILTVPDINLAIGAAVATTLYGRACPVLAVTPDHYANLITRRHLSISSDGMISAD
jgi:uncharacterized protein